MLVGVSSPLPLGKGDKINLITNELSTLAYNSKINKPIFMRHVNWLLYPTTPTVYNCLSLNHFQKKIFFNIYSRPMNSNPSGAMNAPTNAPPQHCISKEDDPEYVKRKMFFQAIVTSLLLVGAFVFYDIMQFFKIPNLKLFRNNIYLYHTVRAILHVLFVFALDISLRYTFAFFFNTPI